MGEENEATNPKTKSARKTTTASAKKTTSTSKKVAETKKATKTASTKKSVGTTKSAGTKKTTTTKLEKTETKKPTSTTKKSTEAKKAPTKTKTVSKSKPKTVSSKDVTAKTTDVKLEENTIINNDVKTVVKEQPEKVVNKVNKEPKAKVKTKKKHTMLKVILFLVIIFIAGFTGIILRRISILTAHAEQIEEGLKQNNYSVTAINNSGTDKMTCLRLMYKDDKAVRILQLSDGRVMYTYYDNNQSITRIDDNTNKIAFIKYGEDRDTIVKTMATSIYNNNFPTFNKFIAILNTSITNEKYYGKDCYKIKIFDTTSWIDKENLLVLKTESNNDDGTDEPSVSLYQYEFGTVTNKEVSKPDLTGYKINI